MIEGRLIGHGKIIAVGDRPQVGKGLEIVSPAAQTVEMARALVRSQRGIKRKRVASKTQSKKKRPARRTSKKPTKKKQQPRRRRRQ